MSYKTLSDTGTMNQSFHFEVTPQKNFCGSVASASNCVCLAGGKDKVSQPGDQCFQYSEKDCPELSKFCCPKGTVGRPKVYSNGYRFEYTRVGSRLKPWPPCQKDHKDNNYTKPNSNINSVCFDQNKYEWNNEIYKASKTMRPPVF